MATTGVSTAALRQLRNNLAGLGGPPFQAKLAQLCGAAALKLVADEFRGSHAPDGTAWAPLASRKGKPLLDTGRLRASFAVAPTSDGFRIGTAVAYAGYHQFGTRPRAVAGRSARQGARGRFVGSSAKTAFLLRIRAHHNRGIPARPMLPVTGQLPPAWRDAFQREIAGAVALEMRAA